MAEKRKLAEFDGGRPTKRRPPQGGHFHQPFASRSRDVAPNVDSGATQDDGSVITISSSDSCQLISYNSAPAADYYERPGNESAVVLVSDNDSVFSCVSAHGGVATDYKSDDQYSIRCSDHETAVTLISSGNVSCASENDNNYYGDVDTDDDGAEDDGSVWWNSDDRTRGDRENVRRYANDASIDDSRDPYVLSWLRTNDFARSSDGADSIASCATDNSRTCSSSVNQHSVSDRVPEAEPTIRIVDTFTLDVWDEELEVQCDFDDGQECQRMSDSESLGPTVSPAIAPYATDYDSQSSSVTDTDLDDIVRYVSDMFSQDRVSVKSSGSSLIETDGSDLGVPLSELSTDELLAPLMSEDDLIESGRYEFVVNMAPDRMARKRFNTVPDQIAHERIDMVPDRMAHERINIVPDQMAQERINMVPDRMAHERIDMVPDQMARERINMVPDQMARERINMVPDRIAPERINMVPDRIRLNRVVYFRMDPYGIFEEPENAAYLAHLRGDVSSSDSAIEDCDEQSSDADDHRESEYWSLDSGVETSPETEPPM